jgi:hypothetical protein
MKRQTFHKYFEDINKVLKSHHTEREKSIKRYFSDISFRMNNFNISKKRLDIYLSNDFNVFELINPDENKLSDIIADLLDVHGTHGQGNLFLYEFFSVANINQKNISNFKVVREDTTTYISRSNRRIDITIDLGDFGIGIENNPWASDQADQVNDYKEHLDKKFSGNFSIVYVTGDGSEPTSIDEKLKRDMMKQKS